MGRAVNAACISAGVDVVAAIDHGDDVATALKLADVYIDFTTPAATKLAATIARDLKCAAVIGTTGLGADEQAAIDALAKVAPVVVAANFSVGVNVLLGLVERASRALGRTWDAEVVELHHHHKRDAPSGTALALGKSIAAGHDDDYDAVKRHGRDGDVGPRPLGEIGMSAVRGGDVVGEHTVYLFGEHERLELSHRATDRSIFAIGAVRAAVWVVGKPPGRYDMLDVLGLR